MIQVDLSGIIQRKRQWRLGQRRRNQLFWSLFYFACGVALAGAIAYRLAHNGGWWVL